MNRIICLFLMVTFVSLIICGCGESAIDTSSQTKRPVFGVANDPGSSLMEYDPDRKLYITLEGCDLDFYANTGAVGLSFYILSKNALDANSISVSLPTQTSYDFHIRELTDLKQKLGANELDNKKFPYYLYQIYRGTDWAAITEAWLANDSSCQGLLDEAAGDFQRMPLTEIPGFYVYTASLIFTQRTVSETIEYLDITIGEQVIRQQIGQIRLHDTCLSAQGEQAVLDLSGSYMLAVLTDAWSDGTGQQMRITFTPQEDMTLTHLGLLEDPSISDLYIQLTVTSEAVGSYTYEWDGAEPVDLYNGETVTITILFRDTRLQELQAFVSYYALLEYETEDGTFYTIVQKFLQKQLNLHELYAIVFKGLDVVPYYQDFYYPVYKRKSAR